MVSQNFVRYVGYLGAAANWLIPIAGIRNFPTRPYNEIDPVMTTILLGYSSIFCRWSIAITPANYPLLACHLTNVTVQAATLTKKMYGSYLAPAAKEEVKKIE